MSQSRFVIVMGVSGSGKSTLGQSLATHLGTVFLEGDDYHPAANKAKMSAGIALNDDDRWPWLDQLAAGLKTHVADGGVIVGSCSALKRRYRDRLRAALGHSTHFICLQADKTLLQQRMSQRVGHYMPVSLLDSQLDAFEPPQAEEGVLLLSSAQQPEVQVQAALDYLSSADPQR
jgi:gluconokinase